ncbi:MAG: 50S ribosomal protein L11 methyltransferase [Crocinitomix sp.]|nr:50S ribosomal protein L11 methyltransferase [Crocinitomix sp.]
MNYIELSITFNEIEPWRDIMVSNLAEKGFESFVETKSGLQSYIPENDFNAELISEYNSLDAIAEMTVKTIQDENWNAEWEKNFDPVFVEDKLAIVAPFHKGEFSQEMVITIQPQMSFGTGHHQTTWLASKRLFDLDVKGKRVLDMGTGTGILAVLAEKLGGSKIYAPDIDEWSYRNAQENCALNSCENVTIGHGDHTLLKGRTFDLIIANINKNILISHFEHYAAALINDGILLISGFFETDKTDLVAHAEKFGFVFERIDTKDEWALVQLRLKK